MESEKTKCGSLYRYTFTVEKTFTINEVWKDFICLLESGHEGMHRSGYLEGWVAGQKRRAWVTWE